MVNRNNVKAVAIIVGIFLGGAGTGSAVTFAWSHNRLVGMLERTGPLHQEMRMRTLQRILHLSSKQHAAIADILEREGPARRKLMGEMMRACGEPIRAHKARVDAEIRAVLRPDQQARFDELAARQN